MKRTQFFTALLAAGIAVSACETGKKETRKKQFPSFTAENMDLSTKPGENFYQYANGGWMKQHPLPDDKSRFGSFDMLAEVNRENVKKIINTAAEENAPAGTVSQKIGDFYASGMDTLKIEKEGIAPIKPYLEQIKNISSKKELIQVIGEYHRIQLFPLFYFYSTPDKKNSDMMIAGIYQGGLGLPDRDYYLEEGERAESLRASYINYLTTLYTLSGIDEVEAAKTAQDIMRFETRLAKASNTMLENRDPHKTYNKTNVAGLKDMGKGFPWDAYVAALKIDAPAEINVNQPKFLAEIGAMFNDEDLAMWKDYLKTVLLRETAAYLPSGYVQANFEMYGKALSGQKAMQPRWKTVLNTTSGALGEAVGQLYVKEFFPPEAKTRMETLVKNLQIAFGQRIDQLDWMSAETKVAAKDKLAAMNVKIGYPNKWRDYSELAIKKDAYVLNVLRSNEFEFEFDLAKVGKAVDKDEWHMTPQTVNAYYSPLANEVVFPAAILQPPFFYLDGDDAVNYGAIGVVIGHEMTHGFDDQGRQYSKEGNLQDWWTAEDAEKFNAKTQVLVNQFDNFIVLDDVHANGKLSLGENIADFGGLCISHQALHNAMAGKSEPAKIDGFTAEQRFFLAYSRVWAQNIRDAEILRLTKEDVHSLGKFRVHGPLPNLEAFYQAFAIDATSSLYIAPENRAKIW
ncbi:M13 family peptidase [Marinilabiliaceae bacterium JC017]|nr:M13 family peptidase [Marinilabiliaceae bacterium JC017]